MCPGLVGGQATEKAKEYGQPTLLHFVNVAARASRGSLYSRNAEQGSKIRAHVMRNYLEQKSKPSTRRDRSPPVLLKLSDHLNQFRLPPQRQRKGSNRETKQAFSGAHIADPAPARVKIKTIMPKNYQVLHEPMLVKPLGTDSLFKIPTPTSISKAETSTLLEYYHTSFWDNSLACNPEGNWMSIAISDPAIFHATLCLVALHKSQTRGAPQAKSYFWHRGEAMRLISRSLADPGQATSDATILAVAVLSSSDNSVSLDSPSSFLTVAHSPGVYTQGE